MNRIVHLILALGTVGLLALLLALMVSAVMVYSPSQPQRALAQGPAGDDAVRPATATPHAPGTGEPIVALASTPPPLDCTKPLPGQVTKIADNDAIMVSYLNPGLSVHMDKLDNKSDGSKSLVLDWDWSLQQRYDLFDVTTADLNGDTKAEVVAAYSTGFIGNVQLGAVSFKNPAVNDPSQLQTAFWTSSTNCTYGIFGRANLAAGNLDGGLAGGDKADEVVLAFQDACNRLQVILLDGTSDGGIKYLANWENGDSGRSYILSLIAVAVGDVDGDGYDNDIVLAFVDGYKEVQVVVLKLNQSGGVTVMGWNCWTDNYRGNMNPQEVQAIDVTIGDFKGDYMNEIAVAFRDASHALQVMQIEYDPASGSLTCTGWWRDTSHGRNNASDVSVAAGDIDDDGNDEIISCFVDASNHLAFVTLDAESANPTLHGSWASGAGEFANANFISLAAGDIDGKGQVEIVVTFADSSYDLWVVSYNDNPACPCADDDTSGLIQRDALERAKSTTYDYHVPTGIALGDVNGDSIYGDYTGVCTQTVEVRMTALVGRPPYWQQWNPQDNEVGYGKSAGSEEQSDQEVTTNYGSSVTIDATFELGDFRIGPTFTKDWETSIMSSTATGTQIETRAGWTLDGDGFVPLNGVTFYSYQYKRRDNGGLARVGVPVDAATDAKTMSYWNDPDGQRVLAPTSWVPTYRSGWMDQVQIAGPIGIASQGAGSDFYDINGNGTPDYLFAWMAGLQNEEKVIYYRIGWDVGSHGQPTSWSPSYQMPDPGGLVVGVQNAGLGAALTELNGNHTPELVVAWVSVVSGGNRVYYCVGWDMAPNGTVSKWSARKTIPGWVGAPTQGAGLDLLDYNGNGRPEIFFGWIDHPTGVNQGWYRVGWDLNANGDSANWWPNPKPIQGAFGPEDAGLGLTLADVNADGNTEMVAAWVRTQPGGNEWAYAVGEGMDGNAYVGSWAPGLPIAGWVGTVTDAATLAAADLVTGDNRPELVVGWIDHPASGDAAWLRVGQYWPLGGDPNQYPTVISDTNPTDGQFQMYFQNLWWNVSGDVNWRWDSANSPIVVGVGSANPTWSVDHSQFTEHTTGTSQSYNIEVGGEATFMGVGVEGSTSYGFENGSSQSISWDQGWYMEGQTGGLPRNAPQSTSYKYVPFTYMQEARSIGGNQQGYMVLDYIVPYIGPVPLDAEASATSLGVTPGVPLIASPSHPDPDAWYPTNTVVFTWAQPAGDPAVVDGYRWYLDRHPDTVPSQFSQGLTTTTTYKNFPDGLWYLHLRARGQDGDWSATAHRAVRLDAHPPQVQIVLNPPRPSDNGGWYNTPVTATIAATDPSTSAGQTGSGVASVEVSTNGITWQPYAAPLVYHADMPLTTLWARATDAVGHTSTPVSTTFGLDLTAPTSVASPGCWNPGGNCVAEVFTDTLGNQTLRLAGEVNGSLAGLKGVAIRVNGADWVPATSVVGGRWFFTSTQELGAGCHTFDIRAEDRAGNVETAHTFVSGVVWPPRERPDLSGSSLWAEPATVRPGEIVTFSGVVRNSGWQETWVPITVELPLGLETLTHTIGSGGAYDPAARTITWPPRYLWPGQDRALSFSARVDAGSPATTLVVPLTTRGTWPLAGACPPGALPGFLAHQTTTAVSTTVTVSPTLPVGADVLPPVLYGLSIAGRPATNVREVSLRLSAAADARWMYLREWTWHAGGGTWVIAQESGWRPYAASYPWTLSPGDGVKYLGVWLADAVGNVSVLDSRGLAFTNLLNSRQSLAAGQRIQYRFPLYRGELAVWNVIAHQGNPDLYVWQPWSGFRPHYSATGTGLVDAVGFLAPRAGLYLVEVQAQGDTVYQLLLAGDIAPRETDSSGVTSSSPEHPLTVSDPLSAGAAVAPAFHTLYLPIVMRNW